MVSGRLTDETPDRLFTGWRGALIALFCLAMAAIAGAQIIAQAQSYGVFGARYTSTDGMATHRHDNGWLDVTRVDRGGAGDRAGIAAGDQLRYDDPLIQSSNPPAGTIVQITVRHTGHTVRKLMTLQPVAPDTDRSALGPHYVFLGGWLFSWLLGILVLWRGWGDRIALVLAVTMFGVPSEDFLPWWFLHSPITPLAMGAVALLSLLGVFIVLLPAYMYHARVARLGRLAWGLLFGLTALISALFLVHTGATWGIGTPPALNDTEQCVGAIAAVMACWWAWRGTRDAAGAERKRFIIVLLAEALVMCAWLVGLAQMLDPALINHLVVSWLLVLLNMVGFPLMLSYAVLRHRVVDLGFVVNRTIVFGSVSVLLLGSFGLIEWGVEHWLPESWVKDSVWIDAGAALLVYLAFHRVHEAVEQRIEHVFFHKWQANEAILRRFAASAPHFEDERALARSFADELARFSGEAPIALYRRKERTHDAILERTAGSWDTAPRTLPVDDPAFALMRSERSAIDLSETLTDLPGVLALPMLDHGTLGGLVLMGLKGNGALYRPDEVDVLGRAAHDVALAMAALHAGLVESENRLLKAQLARLGSVIGDRMDHAEI